MESLINFIKEYNPFSLFLKYIFSKNSIVQGSTVLMIARTIETQRLFDEVYPHTLGGESRQIASWAMALGIEWGILMVTVHSRHTANYNHKIYAVSGVIMTMLFLGILKASPVLEFYITVTYLSLISGYSLYSFCEILVKKANAEVVESDTQLELTQFTKLYKEAHFNLTLLTEQFEKVELELRSTRKRADENEMLVEKLTSELKEVTEEYNDLKLKSSRTKNKTGVILKKTGTYS